MVGIRTESVAIIERLACNLLQHHDSVKMEFLNHHLVVLVEKLAKMHIKDSLVAPVDDDDTWRATFHAWKALTNL